MPIVEFLAQHGWQGATLAPLAGDASARRYMRVQGARRRAVLMVAPPATAGAQAKFLQVAQWLRTVGISAPEILAADLAQGLILTEDLGDDSVLNTLGSDATAAQQRYVCAIDVLVHLQRQPVPDFLPPYARDILLEEAGRLLLWYLPAATKTPVSPDLAAEYFDLLGSALQPIVATKPVVILRDYHGQNLHWLSARQGIARLGVLDFQDALAGHPVYDLVSLTGDVRGVVSDEMGRWLAARFGAALGYAEIEHHMALLGAQRALKILGLFVRLAQRDGKRGYLALLPRCWQVLDSALSHPELAQLRRFVRAYVPPPGDWLARI